jgi:hypothetical protein
MAEFALEPPINNVFMYRNHATSRLYKIEPWKSLSVPISGIRLVESILPWGAFSAKKLELEIIK